MSSASSSSSSVELVEEQPATTSANRQSKKPKVMISCRTSDGHRMEVPIEVLRVSRFFDTMCTTLGIESGEDGEEGAKFEGDFEVKNVEKDVFEKVVEWCKEHVGRSTH